MYQFDAAHAIAVALTYNPTLLDVKVGNGLSGLEKYEIDTFHNLERLLKTLVGEDGAQVLGSEFQIKYRCVVWKRK
jgi:hypothetical protein